MTTWPTEILSSGFVYVQLGTPSNPAEGETWYDLDTDEAKVYDGSQWHRLTVTEHSEIGGVSAGQHRSDSNIQATVDGQVNADTVDGQHASELGGSVSFRHFSHGTEGASGTESAPAGKGWYVYYVDVDGDTGNYTSSVTLNYADGSSSSYSSDTDNGPVHVPHRNGSYVESIDWNVGDQYSGLNFAVIEYDV